MAAAARSTKPLTAATRLIGDQLRAGGGERRSGGLVSAARAQKSAHVENQEFHLGLIGLFSSWNAAAFSGLMPFQRPLRLFQPLRPLSGRVCVCVSPPQAGHDLQQAEEDPSGSALPADPRLRQDEGFAAQRAGAELRREPAALQLRAGVAAQADPRGRPGDVRVPQDPGWKILLDHQRGWWRPSTSVQMFSS